MADLKTNYKDDVLDTSKNEKRKFRMIQNDDGTVSFDDATEYTQQGDAFGAADINATNAKINEQNQSLDELSSVESIANSELSNIATFDTSSWDDGAYLIFNYYVGAGSFFELLIKQGSNIAITNLTRKSTVKGTVVTMEVGSFWSSLMRKCIYR